MHPTMPTAIASIWAALVAAGGCATTTQTTTTTQTDRAPDGASAKRVAGEAAGRLVAAQAFSEHWTVAVQPGPQLEHPTTFTWGIGPSAVGTLREDSGDDEVLRLTGTLMTTEGERPTTITFAPGDCVDAHDGHHAYLVTVEIAGIDADSGCGDLAK